MYIQVKLLKGYKQKLTYKVPENLQSQCSPGMIVHVPIRNTESPALITDIVDKPQESSFAIKEIIRVEKTPHDQHYNTFIEQLSLYYQVDRRYFAQRLKQFLDQKEGSLDYEQSYESIHLSNVALTDEQQQVVDFCIPHINTPSYTPIVLHGVTGSGKTEIYKKLIAQTLELKKSVILLLPEVTLALYFEQLLKQQLGINNIFGFHSGTKVKDKKIVWQHLIAQTPLVVIGVHLPPLLPIANLGLIIIDEEHEVGFQEKKHPKINSKEAALYRAKYANVPIILGSATPSLATLYNVKTKGWHFFQLKQRFSGNFPTIEVASLSDKKQRRSFWITQQLKDAINQQLEKQEQTIIFINRRGYSFFVQCKGCSFIFECSNCSVSLTLHVESQLHCHYCGFTQTLPQSCIKCKTSESYLKKGIGTQQAVEILQQLFPQARIARADMDTTMHKKQWKQTMQDMKDKKIDILVGTQTITKGYHFPHVTLVGILWADLNLNFPIFNAAETTLAQLIQVAGRAGRNSKQSKVIVQTMMEHPIYQYLNEIDYLAFYDKEIQHRTELGYPPYKRLAEIELKHHDETILQQEANLLTDRLIEAASTNSQIQILGPAKPPIYKIQNSHRQKIYIKAVDMKSITVLYNHVAKSDLTSTIFFTPNPLSM